MKHVSGEQPSTVTQPPRRSDGKGGQQRLFPRTRPISELEATNPREFQISQIRRRFGATQSETTGMPRETLLKFKVAPTDPDFPFDLDWLECEMRVPAGYARNEKEIPGLHLTNKDLPRGYQIKIERAFKKIWGELSDNTLLNTMKRLDRELEAILSSQDDVVTVKITRNAGSAQLVEEDVKEKPLLKQERDSLPPLKPLQTFTPEQVTSASAARDMEIQQLQHRMGSVLGFAVLSTSDAFGSAVFKVPISPRKPLSLPLSVRNIKSVIVSVPARYKLDDFLTVKLDIGSGANEDAEIIQEAFGEWSQKNMKTVSVLSSVNYLAQNMHQLAVAKFSRYQPESNEEQETHNTNKTEAEPVKPIRPIEWDKPTSHSDSEPETVSDSEFEDEDDNTEHLNDEYYESQDSEKAESLGAGEQGTMETIEKGVLISLPNLSLFGIELLELSSLSITIKCTRCKTSADVHDLRNATLKDGSANIHRMHALPCKRCNQGMSIGFRQDLIHANSVRAGYLDLEGCRVSDLLPSIFTPTCSDCSTTYTTPGINAVRGDTSLAICRGCHRKMTMHIADIRFLDTGSSAAQHNPRLATLPTRKLRKAEEAAKLGIVTGSSLPARGTCKHYSKSYRWFRFACCGKIYPCDKCHDEAEAASSSGSKNGPGGHLYEFANRMVCGFCSREQLYRPSDCGLCHGRLTGKATSGFWEGGKGTRDKNKMSRKDPRKYKRTAGK